jgi:hypothetical protein
VVVFFREQTFENMLEEASLVRCKRTAVSVRAPHRERNGGRGWLETALRSGLKISVSPFCFIVQINDIGQRLRNEAVVFG